MKKIMSFLLMLMILTMPVKAEECSYTAKADAMKKAANVKMDYEIVEDKQEFDEGTAINEHFKITILNVTEDLYISVTNDVTNETKTYTYNDAKDGIITFDWENIESVTNFVVKVYANKEPCYGEELKTIRKQTPRYNDFYNRAICAEEDMKDFYLCEKYTTVKEIDESMFIKKVDTFMDGKIDEQGNETENTKNKETLQDKIAKYKYFIIGGSIVLVAIGVTIVVKKRNRGKKVR